MQVNQYEWTSIRLYGAYKTVLIFKFTIGCKYLNPCLLTYFILGSNLQPKYPPILQGAKNMGMDKYDSE